MADGSVKVTGLPLSKNETYMGKTPPRYQWFGATCVRCGVENRRGPQATAGGADLARGLVLSGARCSAFGAVVRNIAAAE